MPVVLHVKWLWKLVNMKVGGKCLLLITFTSYPIYSVRKEKDYFCTNFLPALMTTPLYALPTF